MKSSTERSETWAAGAGELSRWTPDPLAAPEPLFSAAELERVRAEAAAAARSAALVGAEQGARLREAALLEEAQARLELAIEEAHRHGLEQGREEGARSEAVRLREAVRSAEAALDGVRAGEARWTGTIEENVCALATLIARQIIGREVALGRDSVRELVRSALAEFPIDQPVRIRINPADLDTFVAGEAIDAGPAHAIAPEREVRWVPDPAIAPGGCIVEGRERIIDGRVDTALERVYRRLTGTHA